MPLSDNENSGAETRPRESEGKRFITIWRGCVNGTKWKPIYRPFTCAVACRSKT